MKILLKSTKEKKALLGFLSDSGTDLASNLAFAALLAGPAAGFTAAGVNNMLSRPSESDMSRLRMLELAVRYERAADNAEQRAFQRMGGNR